MDGIERFVISTGRSGSTMLSTMLHENRRLLSGSEFMAAFGATNRYPDGPMDSAELVRRVSAVGALGRLMAQRSIAYKETTYDSSRGRYQSRLNMPTILRAALPLLAADDPDALFDELAAWAAAQPTRSVGDQYRALLAWFCERLGRDAWVERSGASIRYLGETFDVFPEARYLHLHRDGPESALSMTEHAWFVLAVQYREQLPTEAEIEQAFRNPRMSEDDPVDALLRTGQGGARAVREVLDLPDLQGLPGVPTVASRAAVADPLRGRPGAPRPDAEADRRLLRPARRSRLDGTRRRARCAAT